MFILSTTALWIDTENSTLSMSITYWAQVRAWKESRKELQTKLACAVIHLCAQTLEHTRAAPEGNVARRGKDTLISNSTMTKCRNQTKNSVLISHLIKLFLFLHSFVVIDSTLPEISHSLYSYTETDKVWVILNLRREEKHLCSEGVFCLWNRFFPIVPLQA